LVAYWQEVTSTSVGTNIIAFGVHKFRKWIVGERLLEEKYAEVMKEVFLPRKNISFITFVLS